VRSNGRIALPRMTGELDMTDPYDPPRPRDYALQDDQER
jgi:hypothetical protein